MWLFQTEECSLYSFPKPSQLNCFHLFAEYIMRLFYLHCVYQEPILHARLVSYVLVIFRRGLITHTDTFTLLFVKMILGSECMIEPHYN